jgi:hypothetical protein
MPAAHRERAPGRRIITPPTWDCVSEPIHRYVYDHEITPEHSWRLVAWCMSRGATELTVALLSFIGHSSDFCDAFVRAMDAFRLPDAPRDPGSYLGEAPSQDVPLWRLEPESVEALKAFFDEGLLTYPVGEWKTGCLENPILYRDGRLMLMVVSHENEAMIRLRVDDLESFGALGLPTHDLPMYAEHKGFRP